MDIKLNTVNQAFFNQKSTVASTTDASEQVTGAQQRQDEQNAQEGISEKLANLTEKLNKQMDVLDTNVRFGFNDKINSMYIKVIEKNTGKEIRQIPSEEAMRLAEHLRDFIGIIFDKES
ncbi:FlaG family protein [Campylobacter sp. MIT 21-1685]|uniref:FlaG family protein n=1 Tax=unclassified Campylobacter TaxID=2593542 RepID=UPI00224AEDA5|nr:MULTISPECIES: FlaG family protein [unclassified Campylobacter]MCX2682916.1 FlaG family protein [Campylobacter sp. MIT 21-1684]MCX2751136.1 FlaG family protein [Campylobacter sp. MIT 21-1682]MCX2807397.1 FlaG family protein [Campylobacter sp. MIT 21-1685]